MEAKTFKREKFIGKGNFGKVYLCYDKNERQKKFAMKVIDLEGSSEDERNLAEKEAILLTTLQHKYILHALTTFPKKKKLCIVTEFCDQGDLGQFLNKRKGNLLEERHIVEWFRQICSALEYLHGRNILHRDIKTQNIFLTGKEMTIKLGDLGLAKVLECSTQKASTFCGSPHYISPEILACKPYNSKSDIWAMGVCVYEMTTLRRPFDDCFLQQLFLKIANDQLPPIPKDEYSTQLINVIERMLCRDADSRPSATELLQDVLFKNKKTSKRMTSGEGQFELGELIGEGKFSKIWECFEKKSGKKFAMKKINLPEWETDVRSLAETEIRLLTSLQNEYILHAVTAFQENETLCIVTEFRDQGDLAQFLEERKGELLDEQRIVEWFRQICSALEYLHARNILHRDIKTQNIFLTGSEMTAKLLTDFSLAKLSESPTQEAFTFFGSPFYMGPEMYTYKPYNSKTDIWSLGVCVYEMVSLKHPFDAPSMQHLVFKIVRAELPPLPERYSPGLIEIIERMMCKEMDRRPSALELLQTALFKNHNSSKVELIPNKKTTLRKLSTNEDLDKTISDNTLRININAREYDSYLPSKSSVSNSEIITLDTELPEAGGSETSSEDRNCFVSTIAADKDLSTFRPSSSTSTKIKSFQSLKRSLMGGATGSDGRNSISSNKMNTSQDEVWAKDLPDERHLYVYFWKRYSVFSQEYECEFVVDGITYNSAEQYMMHQKAVLMGDQENAEIILALDVPHEIKQIGNQLQNFNAERWEESCQAIVERGNMEKFSQNESLKEQLFSTFPKTLVEASPLDNIWGIGLARDDRRAWNKLSWRGQNLLGEILTKVRYKLMEPFLIPVVPEKTEGDSIQQSE